MNQQHQTSIGWLKFSFVIVIALGIFFRFINLDQKPYWYDETYTSLRVSGYKATEIIERLYNSEEISVADLHQYQSPSSERSVINTIKGLAVEEPQHPPLYYVMARFWAQWFGSSVTAMRSLPMLISLLGFPAIYWLCLELFASSRIGGMAVTLLAVSPIHVRYAQEARQYSLWTVIILLSSVAMLRAIRLQTKLSWGIYTLTVIAGFYCHLLFSLVFLGQGIYILAINGFRLSKNLVFYLLSSSVSIIILLPWLWVVNVNQNAVSRTTDWLKEPISFLYLIRSWSIHISQLFVAWHFQYDESLIYLNFPFLILIAVAIYVLYCQTSKQVWLFIVTLICVTALALAIPDLILGGKRSIHPRYLFPCYVGIHLAIAYLLTTQLFQQWTSAAQKKLWQIITVSVISTGVITCSFSAQAMTWWGWSDFEVEIPRIINQYPQPLLISEMEPGMIMPLTYRLNSNTKLILLKDIDLLRVPKSDNDVFIYNPSRRLQSKLRQQGIQSELTYQFRDNSLIISLYHLKNVRLHYVDGNHKNWQRQNFLALHKSCHDYIHLSKRET